MNSHGFKPLCLDVTRPDSKTCLDHMFIREKKKSNSRKIDTFIIEHDITDHLPLMLNISDIDKRSENPHSTKLYKKIDFRKVNSLAADINWDYTLNFSQPELATDYLLNSLKYIINKSENTINMQKSVKKIKPWISNGIVTSIKKRDKLKKNLKTYPSAQKISEYKDYRNRLKKIINSAKNGYYKNKIDQHTNNIKKIYKLVTEITNEDITNTNLIQIKNDMDTLVTDPREIAEFCNNYFVTIGKKMSERVNNPYAPFQIQNSSLTSMYLRPTNKNEIIKHINSLKNNCSSGMDNISTKVIKLLHNHLTNPLVHIINLIFTTGRVPKEFKLSVVTPIYKAGDKNDIGNYRPISVISNIAKIFEKCLRVRLTDFLRSTNVMSNNQFGFMEGKCTSDAMYELMSDIMRHVNGGDKCIALFLDLAKAFDTVSHSILLQALEGCGVRGTVLEVFASYLTERAQHVRIGDVISGPKIVQSGVPQGTVLGPVLFNVYINHLCDLDVGGKLIAYADDTVIIYHEKTWHLTKERLKSGFIKIKNFFDSFKLTLNVKKSNYIAFSITSANRPDFDHIEIDCINEPLKEVSFVKYLGVIIDKHLKWDQHVLYLCKKIRCLIHKFYMLRAILNKKLLLMMYKALVEPLLRYGIIVWGGTYDVHIDQLRTVQNYIVRVISKKPRLYSTCMLYSSDLCNIKSLYVLAVCGYVRSHDKLRLDCLSHCHMTRGNTRQMLNIPQSRRDINQRFLSYLAPRLYNRIPLEIRNASNVRLFNVLFRKYLFSHLPIFMRLF